MKSGRAVRWLAGSSVAVLLTFGTLSMSRQPGQGMQPALHADDLLLVNRWAWSPLLQRVGLARMPQRGDIAWYDAPWQTGVSGVGRIVAVGGDVVELRSTGLLINGHAAGAATAPTYTERLGDAVYTVRQPPGGRVFDVLLLAQWHERGQSNFPEQCRFDVESQRWLTCRVPAAHFFVLNDDRGSAGDSRYFGFVGLEHLRGRVEQVLWRPAADPSP